MRVKIVHKPIGPMRLGDELVEWPEVGGTVDLPTAIAEGMIASGTVEKVGGSERVEKRPAVKRAETRKAKG